MGWHETIVSHCLELWRCSETKPVQVTWATFCMLYEASDLQSTAPFRAGVVESDRLVPEREEKGVSRRFRGGRVPSRAALANKRKSPKAFYPCGLTKRPAGVI